ncbi:diguanylate cyclase domain-containing protein [Sulfurimonas sp.]
MNKKIIISFGITILLLLIFGGFSIMKMTELSNFTQKLYEHPFRVTNATKTIEARIISIHRHMKDIVLSQSEEELRNIINLVHKDDIEIYKSFNIVFDKYLGERRDIQKSYDLYIRWKPIRDEVIYLTKQGKVNEAAAITKGKGAKHIANLNFHVQKMIRYAENKAITLRNDALKSRNSALIFTSVMLVGLVLIAIVILVFLVKNISKTNQKLKEHLYLVNQNIMSVRTDEQCEIVNASNAFLQHFNVSKEELVEKQQNFLFTDITETFKKSIYKTIETGDEYQGEIPKVDANGIMRWYYIHITPRLDEDYSIIGYTIIVHDISDRKELENISKIDALTNIYNRRYFNIKFPEIVKNLQKQERILAFMMIDFDFFKQYNDFYGHKSGDIALKKVAQTLKKSMQRRDDLVFRVGGEEFGILFSVATKEDALELAEKIRENVENLKIKHCKSKVSSYITISAGLFLIDKDNNFDVEELYELCDKALYKAKEMGRNQIACFK